MAITQSSDDRRQEWEGTQRDLWGQRPDDWAQLAEPQNLGLISAALDAADVGPAADLLDIGCGSGLALELAAGRGARCSGIDISPSLLARARERLPGGDLREGGIDALPFVDDAFSAVTAINALQFAFDPVVALAEVVRTLRPDGRLVIGQFAAPERCESTALHDALQALVPPDAPEDHAPYALSGPGALATALTAAGLAVTVDRELPGDWRYRSEEEALRGLLCSGGGTRAIRLAGETRVRAAAAAALARFVQPDGSYVMHNHFRLIVAERRVER
jgi:SAM-dependent methyltransferase